jgi:hypothetical protein
MQRVSDESEVTVTSSTTGEGELIHETQTQIQTQQDNHIYKKGSDMRNTEQQLNEFRRHAPAAQVFDFDDPAQWSLAVPHLEAPAVVQALRTEMKILARDSGMPYREAPWEMSYGDSWHHEIFERALDLVNHGAYDDFSGDEGGCGADDDFGDDFDDDGCDGCGDCDECAAHEESFNRQLDAAVKDCEPKPGTPDYYRAIAGCFYLAPFLAELGRHAFPELEWDVVESEHHAVAWGRSENNPAGIIFDILSTRNLRGRRGECPPASTILDFMLEGQESLREAS